MVKVLSRIEFFCRTSFTVRPFLTYNNMIFGSKCTFKPVLYVMYAKFACSLSRKAGQKIPAFRKNSHKMKFLENPTLNFAGEIFLFF